MKPHELLSSLMKKCGSVLVASLLVALSANWAAAAEEPFTADQLQFFENKVRPLLSARCYKCHGPEKQKSDLRLDSRAALIAGGTSGAALVPGKPEGSLLIQAVNYDSIEMPPDAQLKPAEIAILTDWVKMGAPWPGDNKPATIAAPRTAMQVTDEDRKFWSFQPVVRPTVPQVNVAATVRNPIDAFILEKLHAKDLTSAPQATKRELIRRAFFDLIGLPPTPEEVDSFLADESPEAYERLIDSLLSRPQYGERWGRHWLDVVRFAQTNGYERDGEKPNAWRYRDYVARSFNEDKPYDRFVLEQLAGDELDEVTDDSLTATAFFRLGVWDDEPDDKRQAEFDELDDMLSTTSAAFLGLTVGCARCHDHKFDPLPQEDYYGLLAFLRNIKPYRVPDKEADQFIFANLKAGGQTLAVHESGATVPATHVLVRGSAATPAQEVQPHFLQVLCQSTPSAQPELPKPGPDSKSSGRRKVLANWIASPTNPLTARVIVNRIWQHHFGRGLVTSPNDFGRNGARPSHPELLDYLASELIDGGWRLKQLHKRILLSATFQQSSQVKNERGVEVDPDNVYLWRQNLRRLEAEAVRDAILATNGRLNLQMGGRGIFPTLPDEVLSTQSRPGDGWDRSANAAEQSRRSLYIFVKRTLGVPLMETFDAASPDTSTAVRTTTTIAPQALVLLNSRFMDEQALAFATRLIQEQKEPTGQVERAFRLAMGRSPTPHEAETALAYLERQQKAQSQLSPEALAKLNVPEQHLANWTYFGGDWTIREDQGHQVEPNPGAKAVWDAFTFADGTVECEVMLLGGGGDAGILVRADQPRDGTDAVTAYNINFLRNQLRLGKHQNNWRALASAPVDFVPDQWQRLKVKIEGARIQIFFNGAETPQIDFVDPEPLPPGRIGFRTFQARAAFRNLKVQMGEETRTADAKAASAPIQPTYREALASLCKIILNLNEFVYID